MLNKIKTVLKDDNSFSMSDLPKAIRAKYLKSFLGVALFAIVGTILSILGKNILYGFIMVYCIAAFLTLYILFSIWEAKNAGIKALTGECVDIIYPGLSNSVALFRFSKNQGKRKTVSYILSTPDGLVKFKADAYTDVLPVGCKVKVYVSDDASFVREKNGIKEYCRVLGYEAV